MHPPAERGDNGDVPGSMPSIDPYKELCDFIKTEREWTMENTTVQEVKMPITYDDLKASMIDSGRPYDFEMIDRAYELAAKAHGEQRAAAASRISVIRFPWRRSLWSWVWTARALLQP